MLDRELIEGFHLLFSHRLSQKIGRNLFSLKGGCNLRFYFHSIRYSEDIDYDVVTVSVETLKKQVSKILDDASFIDLLRTQKNIELHDWSDPKQTETTQRWKVQIKKSGQTIPIPTKIEFSRRIESIADAKVEPVDPALVAQYRLQPILLQHYLLPKAIQQKIGALIHRTETQARDIIDLKILKDRLSGQPLPPLSRAEREKAVETLMSVSFADFKSQVWPYLLDDYQSYYDDAKVWNQTQDEILKFIETCPEGSKR